MTILRVISYGRLLALWTMLVACNRSSPPFSEAPHSHAAKAGPTAEESASTPHGTHGVETHRAIAQTTADDGRPSAKTNLDREAPTDKATSCGPLDCNSFASAEGALAHVVTEARPRVLAVGEIHAQKGHRLAKTPTARFVDVLPWFQNRAKHLVVELWTGRNDCGDDRVERVRKAQEPVTSAQADTNKNEYFELGARAKTLGIMPHALVPSCQDYQTIVNAKSDDLDRMLELTATKTAELVDTLLKTTHIPANLPEVITYGGALHNDVSPRHGRERWSFGPHMIRSTEDQYVELDWVLREQVHDGPTFSIQPWYPHFRSETLEKHFTLYRTGPRSYVLIFPEQRYLQ
ncbi:MAG: hypothetical protein QM784_03040 [Polyangiaceae bacterium]